jgi:beta-phosphoglucomutase
MERAQANIARSMVDSNRVRGEHGLAVIWDMDGTLVDTADLHFEAWRDVCHEIGHDFTRAEFAATFGRRNPEILQFLFGARFSLEEIAEIGKRKEILYRAAARRLGVELLPGGRALLEGLHAAHYAQAIGSSAPLENVDLILELTKTRQLFDAITSSEDTQRGKPDPQVFEVAAGKLGVPPSRCVVFEDAVAGVQAAKAGRMKCIAVTFVGHHHPDKLRDAGADLVVKSLGDVSVEAVRMLVG